MVDEKEKRIILLTPRERENKFKWLNKKLREVNQKLKNNKKKKRKTDLFKEKKRLEDELNEVINAETPWQTPQQQSKTETQNKKQKQKVPVEHRGENLGEHSGENTIAAVTPPQIQIEERASALRGFARQFRIQGIDGFGPIDFMRYAKEEVLNLMRNNRQTKVNIILNLEMIREETGFTGDVEYKYPHFQSGIIENLEATDEEIE